MSVSVDILVIEDDASIRETMTFFFESEGYSVLSFKTAGEALDVLRHTVRPDLVICDYILPFLSGTEFMGIYLEFEDPAPVILMTAADPSTIACADLFVDVLRKPFCVDALSSYVRRFVKAKGPRLMAAGLSNLNSR